MINSFKNFERLRYRISNDIKELVTDSKSNSDNMKEELSNTIFATVFSAFVTEVAFNTVSDPIDWCSIIKMIAIFILLYIVSYGLYSFIHPRIIAFLKERKLNVVDKSMDAMIKIQKDFDNIACDSILVARNFKLEYQRLKDSENSLEDIESNKNLKVFCYFEIMHYLMTACEKTKTLVKNKEKCIKTLDESEGVDTFRIINILNIMQELDDFLDNNLEIIQDYNDQEEAIKYQHQQIKSLIQSINDNI